MINVKTSRCRAGRELKRLSSSRRWACSLRPARERCTALLDRSQKRCVVERLLEDIHSACPHRVHSYRHIATPGDENDRHELADLPEFILKL